jgi:hypothetical protein
MEHEADYRKYFYITKHQQPSSQQADVKLPDTLKGSSECCSLAHVVWNLHLCLWVKRSI